MSYKWKNKQKQYHKEYHAKWYKENKEKVKLATSATKARKETWFRELKNQYSCLRCGASHPAIIELHHRDPTKKNFDLAHFQKRSKAKILEELEKCDPLCRNCHAIIHWEMRQVCSSVPKIDITN